MPGLPLSLRLAAWVLPAALAALAVTATAVYQVASRRLLAYALGDVEALARSAASRVWAHGEARASDVLTLSQSPLFRDHYRNVEYGLEQEAESYRHEVERMLADLARRSGAYARLRYADASGRVLCELRGTAVVRAGGSAAAEPGFRAARGLRLGQRHVGEPARLAGHPHPVMPYSAALRDEAGAFRGALLFEASAGPVREMLARMRLGASGRTVLTDRLGRAPPEIADLPDGDRLAVTAAVPGIRWSVTTVVSRSEVLGVLHGIAGLTLLIALITSALLILLLGWLVRSLLRPLGELAAASGELAAGRLEARVAVPAGDELGRLAGAFNSMAESLAARTAEISRSEARFRTAIENAPDAVVSLDDALRVTLWNRRAEEVFGFSAGEALGRGLDLVLAREDYARVLEEVLREGHVAHADVGGRSKGGRELKLSLSWAGQPAPQASGREWFVVLQDLTEKRQLEAQLLHAERMSAVGQLIAGVAHELNNPLTGVMGNADLLLKDKPAPREAEALRRLHNSALRCKEIVGGLLHFVRPRPDKPHRVRLNRVAQDTLGLFEYRFSKTDDIVTDLDLDPADPCAAGEFYKLQQVLINLINNACHVLRGRAGERRILIRTRASGEGARLEVEDTGAGVPSELREQVFQPFFSTMAPGKGTGLGLPISARIVTDSGGRLRCEAAAGGGALFVAQFPPCPAGLPEAADHALLPPPVPGKRALAVDDEPDVLDVLARLLREEGLEVASASSVPEALEFLRGGGFDLVVTDVEMGSRKGTELLEGVPGPKAGGPSFLFVTGDALNHALIQELESRGAPWLAKPFLRVDFLRAVRRILGKREGRDGKGG